MRLEIMLQGTASNVGKSTLATALCRIFKQEGYQVGPFKSWNMALNSYVTASGGEVGTAQALQAKAAGVEITTAMQPILVKPKGEGQVQVIVRGQAKGDFSYQRKENPDYIDWAMENITNALTELRSEYEVLILEGAGSPAEINIKDQDLANMKVAKINQTPVLLVADLNRGGALASIVGILKLLEPEEKKLVKGIILNKFRGDYQLLKPAIKLLEEKTARPVVGVVPYLKDFNLPEEDSVSLKQSLDRKIKPSQLKIGIIKLPHISNFNDFTSLELEPGVAIDYLNKQSNLSDYDTVIIPGTKNTTADLKYLKETGLAAQLKEVIGQLQIIGICGGYQMLGKKLFDPELSEGKEAEINGLGLLDIKTTFSHEKTTRQVEAVIRTDEGLFKNLKGERIKGYEIHMGQSTLGENLNSLLKISDLEGKKEYFSGSYNFKKNVWGTYLHGIFANDNFRRQFINNLRNKKGLPAIKEKIILQQEELEANLEMLAEVVRESLDIDYLIEIMKN